MSAPGTRKLGAGMIGLAWILFLGLLTAWFSGWLDHQENPNQRVTGTVDPAGQRQVVLQQNRGGHYVATGHINGHAVRFLLDTGATTVSVPSTLAERLGLVPGAPAAVSTANGVITTYATRIDEVALGNIRVNDVRAHINPHMPGEDVLLGMSFLRHVEFTQRGDQLTLRQLPGGT